MARIFTSWHDTKYEIRDLFHDYKSVRWVTVVSGLFFIVALALPLWRLRPWSVPDQYLPLHYNIYFGIDKFGPWPWLLAPGIIGLVILCVNLIVTAKWFSQEKIWVWFAVGFTLLAEFFLGSAVFFMILLNV